MKIKANSWFFAVLWIVCGAGTFRVLPKIEGLYRKSNLKWENFPVLTKVVFFVTPWGWLAFAGVVAGLLVYRDVRGKQAIFPDAAALLLLMVVGGAIFIGLVLPLIAAPPYSPT